MTLELMCKTCYYNVYFVRKAYLGGRQDLVLCPCGGVIQEFKPGSLNGQGFNLDMNIVYAQYVKIELDEQMGA